MKDYHHRTAVITGAASGFGLEASRIAARLGMNVVMADVQTDALERAAEEIRAHGVDVLAERLDVSRGAEVEALAAVTKSRFGAPHFVFNNAGVSTGGLVWEHSVKDWEWVLGVNLWGAIHGVRCFTPMMLEAAAADAAYEGHIVNTASMAGLVNMPNMGVYSVSKHAVVSLSESLYHDLALITDRVHAHVLCPFFVATGIHESHRNRPTDLHDPHARPTKSQLIAQANSEKAVTSGKVSAADVAGYVFDALRENRFYIYSHPKALRGVQYRMEDILALRNPSDPYLDRPEIGKALREALGGVK